MPDVLTPDDFSHIEHHHDYTGDPEEYMLKSDAYLTYVSRTFKAVKSLGIMPDGRTVGGKLVLVTCEGLPAWAETETLFDWEYRWEHLGAGYGPIALSTAENVSQARITADFTAKLAAWALNPDETPLTDEEQHELTEYINQLVYFYANNGLDGYTGTESVKYKSSFTNTGPGDEGVTVFASAGQAQETFDTDTRDPLYTSRWDPHGIDLVVYRKFPSFVVADYYLTIPGNLRVMNAWAFPGGKMDADMSDLEDMFNALYTGQAMVESSFVSRAHAGFGIRGIHDATVIVRALGKPFYVLALVMDTTDGQVFDAIPEWDETLPEVDGDATSVEAPAYWLACSFYVRRPGDE